MPGRGARSGVDARRAAAVLLLVAVAAVGLRAGGAFSAAGSRGFLGMSGNALYWLLAAGEAILAVVGLVLLVARLVWIRHGDGGLRARKRRSIWWVLLLPIAMFGLSRIIAKLRGHGLGPHLRAHGVLGSPTGAAGHTPPGSSWPVLVLLAVGVLAAGVLAAYRRRRPVVPAARELADPAPDLAGALAAGARAVHSEPDPRAAIIGCYAAMERTLADAGSPAQAADTPAEVLARATADGLVRSTWAGTLTGLFRRARYSSQPMTEADRVTAMGALAQVRADLGAETADLGAGT
jgi:MYXO-CTERM domain-containing protein